MLLAVDVGNTQTLVGMFEREELQQHWRLATMEERTADEWALVFQGLLGQVGLSFSRNVTGVIISSVVPRVTPELREMTERYFHFPPLVIEPGIRTGMPIVIDNPKEVGADRVVNAIAAHARYGAPCIVVDFGTSTNFDVVNTKGEYVGGAIAPGVEVSLNALVSRGAQLRRIELTPPRSVIGKNTVEAIQSGVLFGFAGQVDGILARMRTEIEGEVTTIATGGLAPVIIPLSTEIQHHDPWLTLRGLLIIYERNAGSEP